MAVKIRLKRMGQKKAPFYRIVVADSPVLQGFFTFIGLTGIFQEHIISI